MTKKMTKKEEFEQMKQDFEKIQQDYNQKIEALDDRTRQLDTSITNAQQITEELSSKKHAIESFFEEMNATQESLQEQKNDFDEEYVRIFGEGGLKQEIDTVRKALATYRGEQETVIQTLKEHIESLMPNATSVGLAKAFSDEKEIFKEETEKYSKYFMASIVCLIILGVGNFIYDAFFNENIDYSTVRGAIISLVSGFPIFTPLVWLAYSFAKRRNAYAMLLQEYTHKETFANSYSSYKKQIEDLQDKDTKLLNALLEKLINIIAKNPTYVLNKKHSGDVPADEGKKILEGMNKNS